MPSSSTRGMAIRSARQSVRQVQESLDRLKMRLTSESQHEVAEYQAVLDTAAGLLARLAALLDPEQDSISGSIRR